MIRFVRSSRPRSYSVWQGDKIIGYVEQVAWRLRGDVYKQGWQPTTPERVVLPTQPTRKLAGASLVR